MGMWTSVRGWIELDDEQRAEVEQVIAGWLDGRFARGWTFPPVGWTTYAMYGMDVRDQAVPDVLDLVNALARVTPTWEGDMTLGFFVLTSEYQKVTAWEVERGEVRVRDAPELAWTWQP